AVGAVAMLGAGVAGIPLLGLWLGHARPVARNTA
ncbi:MAG: hypothetical protein JWP20_143, partial [Roseomonas sp.]|nr:hypothetical protein [Roseomonas sp.]